MDTNSNTRNRILIEPSAPILQVPTLVQTFRGASEIGKSVMAFLSLEVTHSHVSYPKEFFSVGVGYPNFMASVSMAWREYLMAHMGERVKFDRVVQNQTS